MTRWFLVVVVALFAAMQSADAAAAQPASPTATACAPSPTVPEPGFPAASEYATPATPTASPVAVGASPVEPAIADQIVLLTRSMALCLTEGNLAGIADLATSEYLGDAFGGGVRLSRSDFLVLAQGAPVIPVRVVSVAEPVYSGMRTVAAEVELVAGNQLRLERWTFVFQPSPAPDAGTPVVAEGHWLVHGTEALSPAQPSGATRVQATLDEYTISLSDDSPAGPAIILEGENAGAEAHELLVIRISGEATTADLLRPAGDSFPPGIEVIGQISLLPGEERELVLVELPAGEYAIVCLFPDASGVPHLSFGQEVTYEVE